MLNDSYNFHYYCGQRKAVQQWAVFLWLSDWLWPGDPSDAIDEMNDFYGNFTVFTADTLTGTKSVKQKIPFGGTEYFELLLKRA